MARLPALERVEDPALVHYAGLGGPWGDELVPEGHRWQRHADAVAAREEGIPGMTLRDSVGGRRPAWGRGLAAGGSPARVDAGLGARRRVRRPDISVIVPFYNVEAYLADCLDSILGQDFARLRGAAGRRRLARRLARDRRAVRRRDPRVRLLTRPNGGLGAARNTGVRAARGAFLTFVDSDDLLPADALAG